MADLLDRSPNIGATTAATPDSSSSRQPVLTEDDENNHAGDETIPSSMNRRKSSPMNKKNKLEMSMEEQLVYAREQITQEKAGKRKLFQSLVKLANELRRTRNESNPLMEQHKYQNKSWYDGGMWRSPELLPGVSDHPPTNKVTRIREAISLSDLFFDLVTVTAFTRVGVAITQQGYIDLPRFLYFAVFWTVWSKEASYSTRFDTTDLSAQMETLFTCFAVLFASLSVQAPINSIDGTRIMIMGALVAVLHCLLHVRVALTNRGNDSPLSKHVTNYAVFNIIMTAIESTVWLLGVFYFPIEWEYRWSLFLIAVLLALRVPRAFLGNDFHAACSERGVLFILLLGFLLQSIVVVATEFFSYQTPTFQDYAFIGSACLMFFCIKLLYVDDSDTLAQDHALLVNRWAAFFFNIGQFSLLLSTTVMGSGLNLLTHSYLAATAALAGPEKSLVCGGFAAVIFSTFFIKSMHLKRVPLNPRDKALFLTAYAIQTVVLFAIVAVTAAMSLGVTGGFLDYLMQNDIELLFTLSGAAFFVVLMSWLDEGVELTLYATAEDSRAFRIHPFGFWWCLKPDVSEEDIMAADRDRDRSASRSLSVLSPLLGSSAATLRREYEALSREDV